MESMTEMNIQEENNIVCIGQQQQGIDVTSLSPTPRQLGYSPSFDLNKALASPTILNDSGTSSSSSITSVTNSDDGISNTSSRCISSKASKAKSMTESRSRSIESEVVAVHSTSANIQTSSEELITAEEAITNNNDNNNTDRFITIYYAGLLVEPGVSIQDLLERLHTSPIEATIGSVYGAGMTSDVCHVATRYLTPDCTVHKVYGPHVVPVYSSTQLEEQREPKQMKTKKFGEKVKNGLKKCLKKAFACFQ